MVSTPHNWREFASRPGSMHELVPICQFYSNFTRQSNPSNLPQTAELRPARSEGGGRDYLIRA